MTGPRCPGSKWNGPIEPGWDEVPDRDHPHPEHPRPQLVREGWQNLNGWWQYAITGLYGGAGPGRTGTGEVPAGLADGVDPGPRGGQWAAGPMSGDPRWVADPTEPPRAWDGQILVPFSPETPLSGVQRTLGPEQTLWYRRTFSPPRPPQPGERVLVHFGAVDQSCRVAVDGVEVGGHTGGYLPFTVDVTDAMAPHTTAAPHRRLSTSPTSAPHRTSSATSGGSAPGEAHSISSSTPGEGHSISSSTPGVASTLPAGGTDTEGASEYEIVVAVRDVTDTSWLSRGKQASTRGGIWYTAQSGIWQTVWCEVVPAVAIERLTLTPDLDAAAVQVTVHSTAAAGTVAHSAAGPASATSAPASAAPATARVRIHATGEGDEPELVTSAVVETDTPTRVQVPGTMRCWSPEDPYLYDVVVELGEDVVRSYVGMRSIGVGKDARGRAHLLLNGRPYLHVGLLDQGYWPGGGYTPSSDDALVADVQLAKEMGFTVLRKHIKVEPLRWYYHCDRLGMLVWQDAVNGGQRYRRRTVTAPAFGVLHRSDHAYAAFGREDPAGRVSFEAELLEMIEHLRSQTCVVMWVPFNEAWGQFDAARIAGLVRQADPTRPVDHASGWHDQGAGDLHSMHVYIRPVRIPRRLERGWPCWPDAHLIRRRTLRVLALTEYGGYSLPVPGATWSDAEFGYRSYADGRELLAALQALHRDQIEPAIRRGLAATIYTQLSDVEDEVNGLITYDRRVVKVDSAEMRAINDRLRAVAAQMGAHARPITGARSDAGEREGQAR